MSSDLTTNRYYSNGGALGLPAGYNPAPYAPLSGRPLPLQQAAGQGATLAAQLASIGAGDSWVGMGNAAGLAGKPAPSADTHQVS